MSRHFLSIKQNSSTQVLANGNHLPCLRKEIMDAQVDEAKNRELKGKSNRDRYMLMKKSLEVVKDE